MDFLKDNPHYIFFKNYQDMINSDWKYSDKYFHAKANCQAAQNLDVPEALVYSTGREIFDVLINNPRKGIPFKENVKDCLDDYKSDLYGIIKGLQNRNTDCKYLLDKYRPKNLPEKY